MKTIIQKVAREAPYRTWRSAQGTKIDARFVKRDGSKITLKDKKGKEIILTAIQLAPGSRNIVRKYEEARKAKSNENHCIYYVFEKLGHQKSEIFPIKNHQKSCLQSKHVF